MATYTFSQSWRIGGRMASNGYSPFTIGAPSVATSGKLNLAKSNTASPIMQGVTAGPYFTNGNYTNPSFTPGSTLIAVDTAGNNVVAINGNSQVIGISIFPGYGDEARLFANAINYLR